MCGIFAYFQRKQVAAADLEKIQENFMTIKHRGPDHSSFVILNNYDYSIFLGFHRLAIVDLSPKTHEILQDNGVYLLCNGEIYNYKDLIQRYSLPVTTGSDCEVILQFYRKNSSERFFNFIRELDGTFAFVLYDNNKGEIYCGRDRIGVRPLFFGMEHSCYGFASEAKALPFKNTEQFKPGVFFETDLKYGVWTRTNKAYPEFSTFFNTNKETTRTIIRDLLVEAVRKRLPADRPIGFLLSGGLDSSLVCSIANRLLKEKNPESKIDTFSIGFAESPDLVAARKVAEFVASNHHEVIITSNNVLEALPKVVYCTETYDTTTIRASIPMYLISKYISETTNIKVVFSGEGSDELFGGYLYFHKAPSAKDFQSETLRLLEELAQYDVLRGDRTVAAWGLEIRTPFLDGDLLNFVTCIEPSHKMPDPLEKMILRQAFQGWLPDDILYRRKEAFSDGVGSTSISTLKEYAETQGDFQDLRVESYYAQPKTAEERLYYSLFQKHYGDRHYIHVRKYWMPKWCTGVTDPSATVLDVYSVKN